MKKLIVVGCGGEKSGWKDSPQKKTLPVAGPGEFSKTFRLEVLGVSF